MTDPIVVSRHVEELVSRFRQSFNSGKTLDKKWRVSQLLAFRRMVTEGTDQLCAALLSDLHKNTFEGYVTEVDTLLHEVQHVMDHLDDWMAPEKVGTDLLNLPGSSYIYKDPLGVVCIIGAWNYPVMLSLLPLVGAIAAGNCALLKVPSDKYSPASSRVIAKLVGQYMDPSCFGVVEGDRVATTAVLDQRYDLIFFTGGSFVGKKVAAAAAKHLTPTILELGGKSPGIVDASADLKVAAKRLTWGAFMNAGQTCVRPDYLLVHASIADALVQQLQQQQHQFYGQRPDQSEYFGRLVNQGAYDRVVEAVRKSASLPSCTVRFGGVGEGVSDRSNKYIPPTLLDFGTDAHAFWGSAVMEHELFGPVLPLLRYTDINEVIGRVRGGEKPLGLYVFTSSSAVKDQWLGLTSSGAADINDCVMHVANSNLPFGGVGASGMGAYHGRHSFDAFSHRKSVLVKTNWLDVPARYPPYVGWKRQLFGLARMVVPRRTLRLVKCAMALLLLLLLRRLAPSKKAVRAWAMEFAMKHLMG